MLSRQITAGTRVLAVFRDAPEDFKEFEERRLAKRSEMTIKSSRRRTEGESSICPWQKDSTRGADYAPWALAVADVHRKSALCRSSFESAYPRTKK